MFSSPQLNVVLYKSIIIIIIIIINCPFTTDVSRNHNEHCRTSQVADQSVKAYCNQTT